MTSFHKFVKKGETMPQILQGRDHCWYFNPDLTKGAEIIMVKVEMEVGACHDFHRHPGMNEVLYFLKGKAEQWVEDEKQIMSAGDSVYIDPDMVHATFNIGHEKLEFLAILSPGDGWKEGTIDEFMNPPYSTYRKSKT